MNTDKLSARLQAVVDFIPQDSNIADIGSDHAYLPCYVVKKGIVPFAIAGEVVDGPFQSALQQVMEEGLSDKISVRKGNGLEVIQQGDVDCITIAGMGGTLIAQILENGKEKLKGIRRIIVQPNISAISIRQWFIRNNWEIVEEKILQEDGKIYEVLVSEQGSPLKPFRNELHKGLLMGPFLISERSSIFEKKWLEEKRNWEKILTQLSGASESEENSRKISELKNKIKMVEEVLNSEKSEWI